MMKAPIEPANTKLDEARRRVQQDTLGHRGRKADPLYRSRRLLTVVVVVASLAATSCVLGEPKYRVTIENRTDETLRIFAEAEGQRGLTPMETLGPGETVHMLVGGADCQPIGYAAVNPSDETAARRAPGTCVDEDLIIE